MKFVWQNLAAAALLLAAVVPASAGPASDLAKSAEDMLADGDHAGALEKMDDAYQAVWDAVPLGFRKTVVLSAGTDTFGQYEARSSNRFGLDEKVMLYVEPVGYGWETSADGYRSELVTDFLLSTPDGKILAGQKGFGTFPLVSAVRNREYFLSVTYTFRGVPPGEYVITTTVRDRVTGKEGSFDTAIVLEEQSG